MVYLDKFIIPNAEQEEKTIKRRMAENGGVLGYIDNIYPCGLFTKKELSRIDFESRKDDMFSLNEEATPTSYGCIT